MCWGLAKEVMWEDWAGCEGVVEGVEGEGGGGRVGRVEGRDEGMESLS